MFTRVGGAETTHSAHSIQADIVVLTHISSSTGLVQHIGMAGWVVTH